ncbi:MAG: DUF1080 domain-containing protein [Chthoniobacter sp.]|uniref:3-keto-disaccharide hydrolase n=1 Tax=Chthoniobacter sp. TaxID=2510640 RepID=UPI0032ADAF0A
MKLLPLVALTFLAAASLHAGEKNLFNGKDLTGWQGVEGFWSVQDGCLTGKTTTENMVKENTFLVWQDGEVGDFELTCKFKLVDLNGDSKGFGNSGIQYRSKVVKPEYFVISGYQADMDTTNKYTGMLYEEKGRGILCLPGQAVTISDTPKDAADAKAKDFKIEVTGSSGTGDEIKGAIKAADWNEYKIIAKGNHLQHFVNGKQTADITDNDANHAALKGVLALQLHKGPTGMTVQFKDMILKTDN